VLVVLAIRALVATLEIQGAERVGGEVVTGKLNSVPLLKAEGLGDSVRLVVLCLLHLRMLTLGQQGAAVLLEV